MSRIANAPIEIPKGVETTLSDSVISVKGSKGDLQLDPVSYTHLTLPTNREV